MVKIFDKSHQVTENEEFIKIHRTGSVHNDAFHSVFAHNLQKLIALINLMFKEKAHVLNLDKAVIEPTVYTSQHLKVKIMDIVLSVPLMNSSDMVRILILLEHKTFQNAKELFKQLFYDISFLYYKYGGPILPVVFYQGMDKTWKMPLSLQEHLKAMNCFPKVVSDLFGANVPDFKYILFNLQEHDILNEVEDVLIKNDLWTFQQIWSLKRGEVDRTHFFKEFFKNLEFLPEGQKLLDLQILTSYLCRFDPTLTLETLQEIERQIFDKEGYFMGKLKTLTEDAREQGLQQGKEQGLQQGKEQGLQQGKEQGLQQGKEQIALKLIGENLMDLQKIADLTGLSEQKLLYLKNNQG